jgi:hypothetical protein
LEGIDMWDDEESGAPSWDAWSLSNISPFNYDYGLVVTPDFSEAFDIANPEFFPASETNPLGYDPNAFYNLPYNWADNLRYLARSVGSTAWNAIKGMATKPDGSLDLEKIAALGGGLLSVLNRKEGPATYQKPIPQYTAVRQAVPQTYDPNRRPGSGGQRYFTDVQYVPKTGEGAEEALTAAQTAAGEQATGLAALNAANPLNAPPPVYQPPAPVQTTQQMPVYNPAYSGDAVLQLVRELLNASTQGRPIQQSTASSSAPTSQTAAPAAAPVAAPIAAPAPAPVADSTRATTLATTSAPAPAPVAAPAPAPTAEQVIAAPILSDDSGIASLASETAAPAPAPAAPILSDNSGMSYSSKFTPWENMDPNVLALGREHMLGHVINNRNINMWGVQATPKELRDYLLATGTFTADELPAPTPPGMAYDQFEGWSEYFTPEGEYRRFTSTGTPISPTRYGSDYGSIAGQYVSPYAVPAYALGFTPDQPGFDARLAADELAAQQNQTTQNLARGGIVGLQDGGFVVPADVVSHLGNGSSRAGLAQLQRRGAVPIQGQGDGMSDSIRTSINNRQPAAVADGEAYFPPERAQAMGGPERLYAMMDRIRKDRTGTTQQGRQINPNKYLG